MNLAGMLRNIRETREILTSEPIPNERQLVEAMHERVTEVVDPSAGEVSTDGKTITLVSRRRGKMTTVAPFVVLRSGLPADERLKIVFEALAKNIQRFLSECEGQTWPGRGIQPHVAVSDATINVWWGGPSQDDAKVRLRPIDREELGV
jgi:hypothetical protein